MYELPEKPKERNLDFLTSYYNKLNELYSYENIRDSMVACKGAELFIYKFNDILPGLEKDKEIYFYLLGKLWACHDYLEGEDE